jgi:hypothetical protein
MELTSCDSLHLHDRPMSIILHKQLCGLTGLRPFHGSSGLQLQSRVISCQNHEHEVAKVWIAVGVSSILPC